MSLDSLSSPPLAHKLASNKTQTQAGFPDPDSFAHSMNLLCHGAEIKKKTLSFPQVEKTT